MNPENLTILILVISCIVNGVMCWRKKLGVYDILAMTSWMALVAFVTPVCELTC